MYHLCPVAYFLWHKYYTWGIKGLANGTLS